MMALLLFAFLLFLAPVFFAEFIAASLTKLHLSPDAAAALTLAIFLGGLINIPVRRVKAAAGIDVHPLAVFRLDAALPRLRRRFDETVIAVNVGGCIVPAAIALYEVGQLALRSSTAATVAIVACLPNIVVCDRLARVIPGLGIAVPGLIPPLIAAATALVLAPDAAAPVAFIAGVAGPLIGADLLHLKDIRQGAIGMVSIGGAGTFDGIVLSAIVAAYIA